MTDDACFLGLQKQHRELLGERQLLSDVPDVWRNLFGEWVREIEEAGAIEAGMRVTSLSQTYDSLRAELVGRSMVNPGGGCVRGQLGRSFRGGFEAIKE